MLLLLSPALFGGHVLAYRDLASFWYPQTEGFVRVVAEGSPPIWNPWVSFGLPMLADPGYEIAYPLTWLNLILLPETYYKLFAFLHVFGAGLGLYWLLRRWDAPRPAAFLGGAVWASCGPLLSLVNLPHHLAGAAWIAWVLLGLDRLLRTGTLRAALALGAAAALQIVAGSGDVCLMTAMLGVAYVALFAARQQRARRDWWTPVLMGAGIALPLALLLSAIQWAPTLGILGQGHRLGMDIETNLYWSFHPLSLTDLFIPSLLVNLPLDKAARAAVFQSREPFLLSVLLGAPAALLIALGLSIKRGWAEGFALGGFLGGLLAAMGRYTPVYRWLLEVTPLAMFRYPTKYLIIVGLLWGCLTGLAAAAWQSSWTERERRRALLVSALGLILATGLGACALWVSSAPEAIQAHLVVEARNPANPLWRGIGAKLAWTGAWLGSAALLVLVRRRRPRSPAWVTAGGAALVLASLIVPGREVNAAAPRELLRSRPPALASIPEGSRVYVDQHRPLTWYTERVVRSPPGWDWYWACALGHAQMLWPPLESRWRLLGSYEGDFTGLSPRFFSSMTLILGKTDTDTARRLLEIGGVDYVVTLEENLWPGFPVVGTYPSVFKEPISVLKVPSPLPRAYMVGRGLPAAEPESVRLLLDPQIDLASQVVLAPPVPDSPQSAILHSEARVVSRSPDSVLVRTRADGPGYLVLAETFDAGWNVTVDQVPAVLLRANVLFRAVAVPAGQHDVLFRYRPAALFWGLGLSATGLLLGAALLWESDRQRRAGTRAKEALS